MTYIPLTTFERADGTSNISSYLDAEDSAWIDTLTPAILTERFGKRTDIYDDPTRGYSDPDWYWNMLGFNEDHVEVWGIGFRWGKARLRGKSDDSDEIKRFIGFLKNEIEETSTEN
tara:strand:- start:1360 stop:1707 length:348 start_codon:yes stop_codon:yes gene_type:complete